MQSWKKAAGLGLVLAWSVVCRCASADDQTFNRDVAPLLRARCAGCHGAAESRSGLVVTTIEDLLAGGGIHGPAVIPGHPEQSPLVRRLKGELTPRMPLEGEPLSDREIATIERWIRQRKAGTVDADAKVAWAFRKPIPPEVPAVKRRGWVRNGIDAFVLSKLEEQGLEPAPEAGKRELLRRTCFDLVGVPPTPEETRAFLDDDSPTAYERLIERLLADPRYGERWGQHWLDVARYGDTGGSEYDREYSHMWRYRDYVIRAFNEDKPYDRFVIEQIAGDEIDAPTIASRVALGLLRMAPEHGSPNKEKNRQILLNELTSTIGTAFLGLTMGCAQCHDHKYDPIPQKDFYRLQAFLVGIRLDELEVPFEPFEAERMHAGRAEAEKYFAALQQQTVDLERTYLARLRKQLQAEGASVDQVAQRATVAELDLRLARAEPRASGPISVGGVERFTAEDRVALERLRNETAEASLDGVFEKGAARRRIDRYSAKAHMVSNPNLDYFARSPAPSVAFVKIRGEFDHLGDVVRPGFLSAVTGNDLPAPPSIDKFGNVEKFRIGLAEWIASADNPLTARVMVNRVWQRHFGQGIVRTPNNFGRNGAAPTHPELLDWLALRFTESGWSIKAMHRLMMTSAAYRQTSNHESARALEVDPQNRLLWRMNRRRLEGEAIRDSVLAVSGRLSGEMGGPAAYPPLPEGMEDRMVYKRSIFWEPTDGPSSRRRSVYVFKRRQLDFPLLATLDAPVFNTPSEQRSVSTTPLQALILMNGQLIRDEAVYFAQRVRNEAGDDPTQQVVAAYHRSLAREPTNDELARAAEFVSAQSSAGLEGLCRVLLNLNEFVYVD